MGVNLRVLVPTTKVELKDLNGKVIAIDAYNTLYQFLSIIRQPNGTPLKDSNGRITSHLSGLLYRTCNLIEEGIKPIYVFDGTPPVFKKREIKRRVKAKEVAKRKYREAIGKGEIEEARMYAQATSHLKDYMKEDSKKLLDSMGIPWVQAPSEGESQAAYLVKRADADYCASQDYDSLLFGAPRLVRNVTISGRRKLPRKKVFIEVLPEIVALENVLEQWGITYKQLVDIGILIGTDYNPKSFKGLGPKTALKLIKTHGNLENVLQVKKVEFSIKYHRIREIFLQPQTTNQYKIEWKEPDMESTIDFLCRERDFSEERVKKALKKLERGIGILKERTTLENWFG